MLKMKYKILFLFIILLSLSNLVKGQSQNENWVKVDSCLESETIYVNIQGLNHFSEDDIYFWTLEENDPPIVIESISSKIHKTKTYFLANKKLNKYSIMEVIYFDNKNNVAANYSYKRNMENEKFKYNYPIIPGSSMEKVLNLVLKYAGK
ncbi:MAG: hypothetical protein V1773_08250 [bacterium]